MEELSLKKLVSWSIANNIAPKNFVSLYNQFIQRQPIGDDEYSALVLLSDNTKNKAFTEKQRQFALHLAFSSIEQLNKFWFNFSKNDEDGEVHYLIKLNKYLALHLNKISRDVLQELMNKGFHDYTKGLIEECKKNDRLTKYQATLLNQVVLIWVSLISYSKKFSKTLLQDLKALLSDKQLINLENYLTLKVYSLSGDEEESSASKFMFEDDKRQREDKIRSRQISLNNLSSKNFRHIGFIKKYIWLSSTLKGWKFSDNDLFLKKYTKSFHPSDVNQRILATDLTSSIFRSMVLAYDSLEPPTVLFVWKNFIVTRLPCILANIKFTGEKEKESLEDCTIDAFGSLEGPIADTFGSMDSGNYLNCDLRQAFVKSCINRELLPVQSFFKIFPSEAKINQQALIHDLNQHKANVAINEHLDEKLLSVNFEFTSLEESGLVEFMNSLPKIVEYQSDSQLELGSTILKVIDDLIYEKNNAKLGRFLLSIVNNFNVLNLIVFNLENGPYTILYKLVNFIDSENFNADEDDNFQDLYSFFGIILLSIILICKTYDIDFSRLSVKESYTIDYLKNFYYGLCDNLTNREHNASDEDKEIISNYNNLLNEWINALFDDSNEGLSDELIKSIKVKHIYKMIPLIYQQAIIAYSSGLIDLQIISNGIDYLTQVFLIPCTSVIINWLSKAIKMSKDDHQSAWIKSLLQVVKSTIGNDYTQENNESFLVTKLVYNITGDNLLHTLNSPLLSEKNDDIVQISEKINKVVDGNFLSTKANKNKIKDVSSIYQKFKSELLNVTNGRGDFIFVNQVFQMKEPELVRYLLDEIIAYQSNPTEDSKIFLHLAAYMICVDSVNSEADIEYWTEFLNSKPQSPDPKSDSKKSNTFEFSISYHYSSIFDEISTNKGEDDDILFSDETKAVTSPKLEEFKSSARRFNSVLRFLQSYKDHTSSSDNSSLSNSLVVLGSLIQENMSSLSV